MPGEPNGIPETFRIDGTIISGGITLQKCCMLRICFVTCITGTPDRDIQPVVGAECNGTIRVLTAVREIIGQQCKFARLAIFIPWSFVELFVINQIEFPVVNSDTVNHLNVTEDLSNLVSLPIAVRIPQRQDLVLLPSSGGHRTLITTYTQPRI